MRGDYGYVTIRGERCPLTLRGFVALIVAGSVGIVGAVYVLFLAVLFALLP